MIDFIDTTEAAPKGWSRFFVLAPQGDNSGVDRVLNWCRDNNCQEVRLQFVEQRTVRHITKITRSGRHVETRRDPRYHITTFLAVHFKYSSEATMFALYFKGGEEIPLLDDEPSLEEKVEDYVEYI